MSHLDNSIASPFCRVRTGAASNVFSVWIKKCCVRQLQLLLGPILGRDGGEKGSSGLGLWRCSDRARRGCAITLRAGACCVARTACLLRGRRQHITKAQPAGDTMRGIMMEDAKTDAAPAQTLIESERNLIERWSWHKMAEVDDGAGETRTWRATWRCRPTVALGGGKREHKPPATCPQPRMTTWGHNCQAPPSDRMTALG